MNLQDMIDRARSIRHKYAELEIMRNGREWTGEELALGFIGDVGDLMKLVQAKEGIRPVENVDEALAHELSDCLWSIIVLADKYGVSLESAFTRTMDELEARLVAS